MIPRRILCAAAALVVAGPAAGLSQATTPGKNGRIAFSRYALSNTLTAHIVVANSDGSGQHAITHAARGYFDDHPDWSPDGSHIAFERGCSNNCSRHIWTVRPDGSGLKELSPPCRAGAPASRCPDDAFPAYSPNGRQIAYDSFRSAKTGGYGIIVADANLRHAHRIANGNTPSWSPDGKQLVFVAQPRAVLSVYVCNKDGSGLHRVTPPKLQVSDQPDWSPDGTRILFAAGPKDRWNLFTIHPDGTGLQQLTHFHGLTKVDGASFSPDGQSIVFSTVVNAVNPPGATLNDIFVMTANGTNIQPITRTRNYEGNPDWGPAR
jgi:Tol biopolymer transport system component